MSSRLLDALILATAPFHAAAQAWPEAQTKFVVPFPAVLRGVKDDRKYRLVKRTFDAFDPVDLGGYGLAVKASDNYRQLRALGITIRKTIDTVIATRCIQDGLTLLNADRGFVPFEQHLGLRVAYSAA